MITNLANAKNDLPAYFCKISFDEETKNWMLSILSTNSKPLTIFCVTSDKTLRQSAFEKFLSALKLQLKCNLLRTWEQAFVFWMKKEEKQGSWAHQPVWKILKISLNAGQQVSCTTIVAWCYNLLLHFRTAISTLSLSPSTLYLC